MCVSPGSIPRFDERERAARGARLLDKHYPGWAHDVDLNLLSILSWERCVVGQVGRRVEGGVDEVMRKLQRDMLGVPMTMPLPPEVLPLAKFGFAITPDYWEDPWAANYRLVKAWMGVIAYRQSLPKPKPVERQSDYTLVA